MSIRPTLGSVGEHELQNEFGTTERAERFYSDQMLNHLNPTMIEFVARQEMAFVATADSHGECDSTFRAGEPGFIHVIDPRTIAYPEYRGNGVMASLGNIRENPHVGILMMDFVRDLIGLHVNGSARIVEDVDLRAQLADLPDAHAKGRTPERWVVVDVEEAYIHCRKHIPRMEPVDRDRSWGTDDVRRKGGDYFDAKDTPHELPEPVAPAAEIPVEPAKAPARKRTAKKAAATKTPATKSPAKKTPAAKTPAKKAAARKAAPRKAVAATSATSRTPVKKSVAQKTTAARTPAKRAAASEPTVEE
ncbi:Predicted flavin-nucleotide-binding protein, pyridoxine 5'-phosphate oxidase superfamily [Rhodococcus maanshanensis]|uniref:Predicted flavin-nucleotide-binding protein, pyridoxine 5'-phosphate oxidase superfamily n=1 Tax=Rhodococcus maanshanensis TaxID=183556 RepID=A0A1H7GM15_9NOCA|nr:Predicted flavin-nucleotide-binding protein, pyridoxine 5'-phosphate oxidase superfamily [Rhodococcus maanshanensis]